MATVANSAGSTTPPTGAYPSDETILGIFDESGAGENDRADDLDVLLAGADGDSDSPAHHAASVPHRASSHSSATAASTGQKENRSSESNLANAKSAQDAQHGTDAPMPEWLT